MESKKYVKRTLSDGRKVVVGILKFGPLFENQAKCNSKSTSQKTPQKIA